ncbi:MAG TPA: TetR/AcrR family transcriptional regulator [Chthoniobacterales bacterium]|nr:TetR/AcrR family transcriptional regulator [Chthoniobacterales bacterium]
MSKLQTNSRPYHHGNLRQALLQAAETALEARGATVLSLRELSREVGVSHTSPRRHFADKQALLDALAQSGFQRLDAALAAATKARARNFSTRLTNLAQAYIEFALKHPALWVLMLEAKHRPAAPRDLLDASDAAFSNARALIKEGQVLGEIVPGDPSRLSLTLGAALQGLVSISTEGKFKGIPLEDLVPGIVKHILAGLRPR